MALFKTDYQIDTWSGTYARAKEPVQPLINDDGEPISDRAAAIMARIQSSAAQEAKRHG